MTDVFLLYRAMHSRGMTVAQTAERCGMTRDALRERIRGERDFTASEMIRLSRFLGLSPAERGRIFFYPDG